MTESAVVPPCEALLWGATKFSDVLQIDPRIVKQALETVPSYTRGQRQVWYVGDAMPAIFQRVHGTSPPKKPADMEPKEALDYYRAQRESLKLADDIRKMIPTDDIERVLGKVGKVLTETLSTLPPALERDCGLPPFAIAAAQQAVDGMCETLYANLINAWHP